MTELCRKFNFRSGTHTPCVILHPRTSCSGNFIGRRRRPRRRRVCVYRNLLSVCYNNRFINRFNVPSDRRGKLELIPLSWRGSSHLATASTLLPLKDCSSLSVCLSLPNFQVSDFAQTTNLQRCIKAKTFAPFSASTNWFYEKISPRAICGLPVNLTCVSEHLRPLLRPDVLGRGLSIGSGRSSANPTVRVPRSKSEGVKDLEQQQQRICLHFSLCKQTAFHLK